MTFARRNRCASLLRDRSGAALAELAMMLPVLTIMLFGSMEFARAMYQQHVITKGVQDAARFAARSPALIVDGTCGGGTGWASVVTNARHVAQRGVPDGTAPLLLSNWYGSSTTDFSVTVSCVAAGTLDSPVPLSGQVPIIQVSGSATFNDIGLLGLIGIGNITLRASHNEMGIGL